MEDMQVRTSQREYPIVFREDFSGLEELFRRTGLAERKVCLITDTNVGAIYEKTVKNTLEKCCSSVCTFRFPAGETSKTLDTITDFYRFFLENRLDRRSVIVGLGGGVTGDMAGFAAATYMRGIPFVQIPTSLLAQVDSSVGGKVGVDYEKQKNLIGAFYQPHFVYINLQCLKTLPEREFYAGMAEAVKSALIAPEPFFSFFLSEKEKIKALNMESIGRLLQFCLNMKAAVVAKDEKETGLREILNFGHTIGHSIETLKDFTLLHGECVSLGMLAALNLSFLKGGISKKEWEEIKELLVFFELPVFVTGLTAEHIYEQLFLDKKVKDNSLRFVLLQGIGNAYCTTEVTKEECRKAILSIIKAG